MAVISLVHTKGGVAKTTSAVYLATAAQQRGLDVVLVDADPQGSALEWAADARGDAPLPFPVVPAGRPLAVDRDRELVIVDTIALAEAKTAQLARTAKELGWKRVLVIDGATVDANFALAARNVEGIDVLPTIGANVYDILKRDILVITKAGVEALEARLK